MCKRRAKEHERRREVQYLPPREVMTSVATTEVDLKAADSTIDILLETLQGVTVPRHDGFILSNIVKLTTKLKVLLPSNNTRGELLSIVDNARLVCILRELFCITRDTN